MSRRWVETTKTPTVCVEGQVDSERHEEPHSHEGFLCSHGHNPRRAYAPGEVRRPAR